MTSVWKFLGEVAVHPPLSLCQIDFLFEELCAHVSHFVYHKSSEDVFSFFRFCCLYSPFPLPPSHSPLSLTHASLVSASLSLSLLFLKMKWLPCYSDLKLVISHQTSHIICTLVLVHEL